MDILSITEHFLSWIITYFHQHQGAHATTEYIGSNRSRGLSPVAPHFYSHANKNSVDAGFISRLNCSLRKLILYDKLFVGVL